MIRPRFLILLAIIVPTATVYLMKVVTGDLMSAIFLASILLATVMTLFPIGLRERDPHGPRRY